MATQREGGAPDWFRWLTLATVIVVYATIVIGGFTRGSGAGLGCGDDWPLCNGKLFPSLAQPLEVIEWSHRFVAMFAGFAILGTFVAALKVARHDKRLLLAATTAFLLLPIQAELGRRTVVTALHPALSATHMGVAAALFGAIVATAIFAFLSPREPHQTSSAGASARAVAGPQGTPAASREREDPPLPEGARPLAADADWRATAKDYFLMLKPGILFLVVLTGLAGLLLAAGRDLSLWTAAFTLLGGAMSAGAANAFNHYLERDTDAAMTRTARRPLPSHRIPEGHAFTFAAALALGAFVLLAVLVNLLAAVLALGALFFYVAVYTLWLKKATPQNIVIGGAAGSFPALVGWAAVTDSVGVPALLLGALIFLWTPPHFWALALIYKDDYARGGFPMMPVVKGEAHTRKEIWWYTLLLVGASLLFYYPLGVLGQVYLWGATVLGGLFIWHAWRLLRQPSHGTARKVFTYSIWYLMGLFAAIGVDAVLF